MSPIGGFTGDAWNAAPTTNTPAYLEYGSGTGSLDILGLEPGADGPLVESIDESDSGSSVNPAVMYHNHNMEEINCAFEAKIPDLTELCHSKHHGHFADHYADTHVAVEDNANWGRNQEMDSDKKSVEMPTLEAQHMHET